MKYCLIFLLMLFLAPCKAQVPYTGGIGSGYTAMATPSLSCGLYLGGLGDGAMLNSTPALICPPFFGGIADGSTYSSSPATICPPFFGGSGDGYSSNTDNFCTILLPVRRINFTAEKQNTHHQLYWTLEGYHPAIITVERSGNGSSYTALGTLAANADPAWRYQYTDTDPLPETNYYRLRIRELDGSTSYSKVLVLRQQSNGQLSVYPVPARSAATLEYYASRAGAAELTFYTSNGLIVRRQQVVLQRGLNYLSIDLSALPAGLYIIRINGESVKVVVG